MMTKALMGSVSPASRLRFRVSGLAMRKKEGDLLPPKWYALAYWEHWADCGVFYPVGLHWIMRCLYRLERKWDGWRCRDDAVDRRIFRLCSAARYRGFVDGRHHGIEFAMHCWIGGKGRGK